MTDIENDSCYSGLGGVGLYYVNIFDTAFRRIEENGGKEMLKRKRIVVCSVLILAALLIAAEITLFINSIRAYELCQECAAYGWEDSLKYSMLSRELKSIISEEEFTDDTPEGRLELYQKLNGLVLDERPTQKFHGSTHGFKTPSLCYKLDVNGSIYYAEIRVDAMGRLTGIEVRNFYSYLHK